MVLSVRLIVNCLCITVFLFSMKAVATDDAYLKMLEGEAEDLQLDKSGQLKDNEAVVDNSSQGITKKNWTWEGDLEGDVKVVTPAKVSLLPHATALR